MQDLCDFLKQVPLFADLSPAELSFLKESALSQRYEPGQIIFSESEPCEGLFVIQTGEIKIFKVSASGREQVLAIEVAGSSLAEPGLGLGREPVAASFHPEEGFPGALPGTS